VAVERRQDHPGNPRSSSGVARVTVWMKVITPIHDYLQESSHLFFFIGAWIHMCFGTINVNAPVKQYILIVSSSPAARFAARHADLDM